MTAQSKVDAIAKRHGGGGAMTTVGDMFRDPRILSAMEKLIPKHMSAEKLVQLAMQAVKGSRTLMECPPVSIVSGVLEAATLGLYLDGVLGHAYLVPYKRGGQPIAQFQIGYRGMIDLACRSGHIEGVSAGVIREGDKYAPLDEAKPGFSHERTGDDQRPMVATWALAYFATSGRPTPPAILLPYEIERVRKSSKAKSSDAPWTTHFDEMAKKTAIRRLLKYQRLSPEILTAVVRDEYREAGRRVQIDPGVEAILPEVGLDAGATQPDDDEPPIDVELPPYKSEPGANG